MFPKISSIYATVGVGVTYDSELRDTYEYLFHGSIFKVIKASQLRDVISYIKNPPNKNNVSSCAYADSAIEVSKKRRDHTSFKYSFLTYLFRKKSRQVGR